MLKTSELLESGGLGVGLVQGVRVGAKDGVKVGVSGAGVQAG
jgi:hypothetical protein